MIGVRGRQIMIGVN